MEQKYYTIDRPVVARRSAHHPLTKLLRCLESEKGRRGKMGINEQLKAA